MNIFYLNLDKRILPLRHAQSASFRYTILKIKRKVTVMKYDKLLGIGMIGFLGLFVSLLV